MHSVILERLVGSHARGKLAVDALPTLNFGEINTRIPRIRSPLSRDPSATLFVRDYD